MNSDCKKDDPIHFHHLTLKNRYHILYVRDFHMTLSFFYLITALKKIHKRINYQYLCINRDIHPLVGLDC